MKKIIYILFFIASAITTRAQNLQFNQVLTYYNTGVQTSPVSVGFVPTGKVWKIEHVAGHRAQSYPLNFSIGQVNTNSYNMNLSMNPVNAYPHGPIWLKAGDEIRVWDGSQNYPVYYFFSIIEFNLVP
jgi:hypothetical protein